MGALLLALALLLAAPAPAQESPRPVEPYAPGCYLATRWRLGGEGGKLDPLSSPDAPLDGPVELMLPPNRLASLLVCWDAQGQVSETLGLSDTAPPGFWYPIWPAVALHRDCGKLVNLPVSGQQSPTRYFAFEGGSVECVAQKDQRRTGCYCRPPETSP